MDGINAGVCQAKVALGIESGSAAEGGRRTNGFVQINGRTKGRGVGAS